MSAFNFTIKDRLKKFGHAILLCSGASETFQFLINNYSPIADFSSTFCAFLKLSWIAFVTFSESLIMIKMPVFYLYLKVISLSICKRYKIFLRK
jgi:hypothetical protein